MFYDNLSSQYVKIKNHKTGPQDHEVVSALTPNSNITPFANTAVVTATNNSINNELSLSLMDKTFPQNDPIRFPELQGLEAVSALTPSAWLRGKFAFYNPNPESDSKKNLLLFN